MASFTSADDPINNAGPEWEPGDNIPGRGAVIHRPNDPAPVEQRVVPTDHTGWNPSEEPTDPVEVADYHQLGYGEAEEEPAFVQPIPVNIVDFPDPFHMRQARLYSIPVMDHPVRVVGRDDARVMAKLTNNDDTETIYLGTDLTLNTASGYHLMPGQTAEIATQGEIYAMASNAPVVSVCLETSVRT